MMERSRDLLMLPLRLMKAPFTVAQQIRRVVREPSGVGDAPRAFVEDLTGRLKAMAGFVMGDDRMLKAGQIERAKAAERLNAVAEEAAAQATERRGAEEFARRSQQARREKERAAEEERRRTAEIRAEAQQAKAKAEAEAARTRGAVREEAQAEQIVLDATESAVHMETLEDLGAAAAEEAAAEKARQEAEAIEDMQRSTKR